MFFWWICGEESVLPVLLLRHLSSSHFSTLDWRIPWTEEPGGLQFIGSQSRRQLKWLSTHGHTVCHILLQRITLSYRVTVTETANFLPFFHHERVPEFSSAHSFHIYRPHCPASIASRDITGSKFWPSDVSRMLCGSFQALSLKDRRV